MNKVYLSRAERIKFCDDRLLNLINLPMIAISQSYLLLGYERRYRYEERGKFIEANEAFISEWKTDAKQKVLSELNSITVSKSSKESSSENPPRMHESDMIGGSH